MGRGRAVSIGEETFWLHLKAHNLEGRFEREFVFAHPRRWRFDFADPIRKIAVEVEGGIWTKSRHTSGKGFKADCSKYNTAALLGWQVYRFSTDMVKSGEAIDWVVNLYNPPE